MTVIEALVQIVPQLRADEQRRVLDLATKMRDAQRLPDITLPVADAGDAAWDAWSEQVRARGAMVIEEEKQRLQALGLVDAQGNALTDALPADMLPSSTTSVET